MTGVLSRLRVPTRRLFTPVKLLLLALVSCAIVITGCETGQGTISPINGANRPTPILGYTNGFLPSQPAVHV